MTSIAYPRDATWWDRPGTARAYHALGADVLTAACSTRIVLNTAAGALADDVESLLCRRPACARQLRTDAGPEVSGTRSEA